MDTDPDDAPCLSPITIDACRYPAVTSNVTAGSYAIDRYLESLGDERSLHGEGTAAPPLFGAILARTAMLAAGTIIVPSSAVDYAVHRGFSLIAHRPLVREDALVIHSTPRCLIATVWGTVLKVDAKIECTDGLVSEQSSEILFRGLGCERFAPLPLLRESRSFEPRPHNRAEPFGTTNIVIDHNQNRRYLECSGDFHPIHVDRDIAVAFGFKDIVVHGLCTLALGLKSVSKMLSISDSRRLRSVRGRFWRPVYLEDSVDIFVWKDSDRGRDGLRYFFEMKRSLSNRTLLSSELLFTED